MRLKIFFPIYLMFSIIGFAQQDSILDPAFLQHFYSLKEQSKYDQAVQAAINHLDTVKVSTNKNWYEAIINWQIGRVYYRNDELNKAANYFQKAFDLHPTDNQEQKLDQANIKRYIGSANLWKGDLDNAIQHYNAALVIYKKYLAPNDGDIGTIYTNLGVCYSFAFDAEKSVNYFEKALLIDLEYYGSEHLVIATDYNNLGANASKFKEYTEALNYYTKALKIRKSQLPAQHPKIAYVLRNIGISYKNLKEYNQALKYLQQEYDIWQKITPQKLSSKVTCIRAIGLVQNDLGNFQAALDSFRQVQQIIENNFDYVHPDLDDLYSDIGITYDSLGQYEFAIEYQDKAIDVLKYDEEKLNFDQVSSRANLLMILKRKTNSLIHLYKKTGDLGSLNAALDNNKNVMALLDFVKAEFYDTGSKEFLLADNYTIFETAIYTCYELWKKTDDAAYLQEAFTYAEKSKSILLLDALKASNAKAFAGIPDSLIQKERNLNLDLAYYKRLKDRQDGQEIEALKTLNNTIFDLQQSYHDLLANFEKNYPAYYQLKYQKTNISVEDIQAKILTKDKNLVEFFVGEKDIFTFLISKDDFKFFKTPKDFPLNDWSLKIRQAISQYPFAAEQVDGLNQQLTNLSNQLYEKLFTQLNEDLNKELIIIPDGALGYLPFEILLKEKPKNPNQFRSHSYLLNDHVISYGYSATMLNTTFEADTSSASKKILAVAPDFYDHVSSALLDNDTLTHLPHNNSEASIVSRLLEGDMIRGSDATLASFLATAKDYHIVHLATHAKANDRGDNFSYLAFAPTEDSTDQEMLFLNDIFNLPLNADMVVLSACETGIGEFKEGEGVMSLARGFAYAGAESIITSLWKISDQSTNNLMEKFYQNLRTGMPKDKALNKAKKDYIDNQRDHSAHPFYWAAFIPIGDMKAIDAVTKPNQWAWIIAGLIFIMLLPILFKNLQKPEEETTAIVEDKTVIAESTPETDFQKEEEE